MNRIITEKMNKKRLIYNINEDIYFYIYNILFILNIMECYSSKESFKDYRKLVFLIDFISNDSDCEIFIRYYRGKINPNEKIKRDLKEKYYNGIEKIRLLRYVLLIMEKHNYIRLESEANSVNIVLIRENHSDDFFNNNRFDDIKTRMKKITGLKVIRNTLYSKFIENIFKKNGVSVWEG